MIVSFDAELAILRIEGDEDRTTSGRRRRPFSAALNATRDVIVDLSDLTFADPSLMIDLACLAQRLRANGVTLWLAHPPSAAAIDVWPAIACVAYPPEPGSVAATRVPGGSDGARLSTTTPATSKPGMNGGVGLT